MKTHKFLNANEEPKVVSSKVPVEKNSFTDNGDGSITFPKGLTITDNSDQWNGTKYDIHTMDLSEFNEKLTANHSDKIEDVIGKVIGIKKVASRRVVVDSIQFAVKESALALFAYNMIKAGYLTDFSIETIGDYPDQEGVYYNAKLVGVSAVVMGNNKSATINKIRLNSIEEAKKDGLDTTTVESEYLEDSEEQNIIQENSMKYVIVKNSKGFQVTVKYKNGAGDEVELNVPANGSVEVPESQAEAVKGQVDAATEPKTEAKKTETQESAADMVKNAMAPLLEKVTSLEKQIFDNSVEEPMFKKAASAKNANGELGAMDYMDRVGIQINSFIDSVKSNNGQAGVQLNTINQFHLDALKAAKRVGNSVTLSDFGNFVMPPEMLTEIEGYRSDFSALLAATQWKETLSLQMSWLNRSGDINMQSVEMCDDGANGNLKPISDYGAVAKTADLEELAAVTPVCSAATRFAAVDLLADVAQGYRTDYDRKRAQLVIARLQQAITETGNQVAYNKTTNVTALQSWVSVLTLMQQEIMNGVYIFNQKTYGELISVAMGAGISGPLSGLLTTGDQRIILGRPYIVVPNELMPSLNTNETKTFVVDGANVTIREAVLYADLTKFKGRTSGGLKYDLSTEAAYEENGTVKSAYQRNEVVLRGSFFRGGAFTDVTRVTGMVAAGVS